jgi:transposase-like protein
MPNPFRYFNSSPEVIRLAVMISIRYPLSLRQVEDLLFERGIDSGDQEGEVLEVFATKRGDRRSALKFLKRTMKRYGRPRSIVTDRPF